MQNSLVETLIGAIVVVVAGVFLFYGYSTAGIHNTGGYVVTAEFDRVDGLANGSDVRMSGIKVGTVVSQKLDQETYKAVLAIDLDSNVKIPDDSSAKITSESLLGGNYVSIAPGGSETPLENGSEIMFTQGSVDLMSLIGQAVFSTSGGEKKSDN
ncbi:MAG: outer membrane lipid asymmetry maintenance protein MlaD [Rhizobiales bacterium]|nr:outer membrane lipid asymmetry maintenance protein MlaD [Hyphomicrobiales bacterium]